MSTTLSSVSALGLSLEDGLEPLIRLATTAVEGPTARRDQVVTALVEVLQSGVGRSTERLELGVVLGELGDPRLLSPASADYWAALDGPDGPFDLGRFMVTNAEYKAWVAAGGYEDDAAWDEEGRAWRDGVRSPWPKLCERDDAPPFLTPNHPVVAVTWWEAAAYAQAHGARLATLDERKFASRGQEKRPYPWGQPFGEGNANTREEALHRTCAVGLYRRDCTPEGVYDLAGNAAEWTDDGIDDGRFIHPGSWEQPSMAAWAKARSLESCGTRSAGLGFRLARDRQG